MEEAMRKLEEAVDYIRENVEFKERAPYLRAIGEMFEVMSCEIKPRLVKANPELHEALFRGLPRNAADEFLQMSKYLSNRNEWRSLWMGWPELGHYAELTSTDCHDCGDSLHIALFPCTRRTFGYPDPACRVLLAWSSPAFPTTSRSGATAARRWRQADRGAVSRWVRASVSGFARPAKRNLEAVNAASRLEDLNTPPSNRLEKLKGNLKDFHSIRINDQWRVIFKWVDRDAHEARIVDYHWQEHRWPRTRLHRSRPAKMLKAEFLAEYGLSQNQLAKAVGISPNRIAEIVK
jgi:toxin HigB-1